MPNSSTSRTHPPFNEGAEYNDSPSRFGAPALAEMPDDIRALCEETRAKIGFVPNVFLAYAKRPEHFRAFMQYHDLLMKGPSGLSRAEREAIVVAVSAANDCLYCVTAHGAALRILGKDPAIADQIAINWRSRAALARDSELCDARQRTGIRGDRPRARRAQVVRPE
jgi:uncharacterized peroxidase-related enzyme